MTDLLRQGLEISALGLGLTFTALGMLVLLLLLLERLFRPRPAAEVEPPALNHAAAVQTKDEEIAAAIAVALLYWQSQTNSRKDLGNRLEEGRGAWWSGARSNSGGHSVPRLRKGSR